MLRNVFSDNANIAITCTLLDAQQIRWRIFRFTILRKTNDKKAWKFGAAREKHKNDNNLLSVRNNNKARFDAPFAHIRGGKAPLTPVQLSLRETRDESRELRRKFRGILATFGIVAHWKGFAIEIQESIADDFDERQTAFDRRARQQSCYSIFCAVFGSREPRFAVLLETKYAVGRRNSRKLVSIPLRVATSICSS